MQDVIERPRARTGGSPSISIMVEHPDPAAIADRISEIARRSLREFSLYAVVERQVTETEGGCVIRIQDDSLTEDHPVIEHILRLVVGGARGEESA